MHRVVHFCVCSGMAVSITRYVLSSAVCWEGSDAAEVLCFLKYVGFFFFFVGFHVCFTLDLFFHTPQHRH